MKAARIEAFGDPVGWRRSTAPRPDPGQVLMRIAACGLNFADLLMMKGTYQDTPEPPFTLGMEVAGVVEAHGEGVRPCHRDRASRSSRASGGLAEYGVFDAARCVPIPDADAVRGGGGLPDRLWHEPPGPDPPRPPASRANACWSWARAAASA
jgi:NADPH2:quinone reductase